MKQEEPKYTALGLRREVAEVREYLQTVSNQARTCAIPIDKAKPHYQVTILYAADIYEGVERIEALSRTVEKFPHLIELVQDQEGDLRKLHNRLMKIRLTATRQLWKIRE